MCSSPVSPCTAPLTIHPSMHPHSMSSGLLPQGLMGYEHSLGLLFSQPVWEALEREQERGSSSSVSLWLLDVTIMEICISEKRYSGPLGPEKYKYFNNKHFQCLPPGTAPGYYFTFNALSRCWIVYAWRYRCFLLLLELIFMLGKVFLVICPLENCH